MLSLASSSLSFAPVGSASLSSARSSPIKMQLTGTEYAKSLPAAGPLGFFDPLGIATARLKPSSCPACFARTQIVWLCLRSRSPPVPEQASPPS